MRLRNRVIVAATAAVLISVIGVSVAVYLSIGHELRRQVDVALRGQADRIGDVPDPHGVTFPDPGDATGVRDSALFIDSYLQSLDRDGNVTRWAGAGKLPVTRRSARVAAGTDEAMFEDVTVAGDRVRVYTVPTATGAYRFGRSLDEVDRSLQRLTLALVVVAVSGALLAATLSRLLATKAIEPVHRLSDAARTIKATGDLSHRLPVQGRDEVASMAASFNEVLDDLEHSLAVQRQLVADASHELRTPLTTLRTNIEVLARRHELPPAESDRIMSDLTDQLENLTDLVGDLVDLARDETTETPAESVRLDEIVGEVLERARRQRPLIGFELDASPCLVTASPDRLERAISNLVDNAAKWSPPHGRVRVVVAAGSVSVGDEGPGIDPEDLAHIFDRFYRSSAARQLPGSGLGLAIVKQFADASGGTVEARSTPGRGTVMELRLPSTGPGPDA